MRVEVSFFYKHKRQHFFNLPKKIANLNYALNIVLLASWLQLIFIYCLALFWEAHLKTRLKIMKELEKGAFVMLDKAYSEFNWQSTGRPQNALNCRIKGKLCLNASNRLNCLFYSNQKFHCVKILQELVVGATAQNVFRLCCCILWHIWDIFKIEQLHPFLKASYHAVQQAPYFICF